MQPEENKWLMVRQPLQPPTINPELEELDALPRSTECLRHFVLSIEWWLSTNGRLRCWLKINLLLGIWLFIPAAILMPVVNLVLHEVDGWLLMLVSIVWKLITLSILTSSVVLIFKHFPSSSKGLSRRRK